MTVESIAKSQKIDPICSRTEWITPAANAFYFTSEPLVLKHETGFAALRILDRPQQKIISSFESQWGFASPIISTKPELFIEALFDYLKDYDFDALIISGIDYESELFDILLRYEPAGLLEPTLRCVADLSNGFDQWLQQRSARFRRSLRQSRSRAQRHGIELEAHAPQSSDELYAVLSRIFDVEERSWKTQEDTGIVGTPLGSFTRSMCLRFGRNQQIRAQFATFEGSDIGYVIGARVGDRYRGFQHSYDLAYRTHSIGKVLQNFAIETLAAEGVQTYDFGMYMDYKHSYSDRIEQTESLCFTRTRTGQISDTHLLPR